MTKVQMKYFQNVEDLPPELMVVYSADMAKSRNTRTADIKESTEPQKQGRAKTWLGQLSAVAGILVLLGLLYGHIRNDLLNSVESKISPLSATLTQVKDEQNKLYELVTSLLEQRVQSAGLTQKQFEGRLPQIKEAVNTAAHAGVKLPARVIEDTGKRVLNIVRNGSSPISNVAWETAGAFLNYRSDLNVQLAPNPSFIHHPAVGYCQLANGYTCTLPWVESEEFPPQSSRTPPSWTKMRSLSPPGHLPPEVAGWVFYFGEAPPSLSAKLEPLEKPQTVSSGLQFFIIEVSHGYILLDGMRMKNVIIRNSRVAYWGGPVSLEHVYFVNCTFALEKTPNSVNLADDILAGEDTMFQTGSSG